MRSNTIHARRGLALALPWALGALAMAGCNPQGGSSINPNPNPTPGTTAATTSPTTTTQAAPALTVDATALVGLPAAIKVTVTDAAAAKDTRVAETVTARLTSVSESVGELVTLTETGADSGAFTATVSLERLFAEDGTFNAIASNGKIAVYAEGGVAADAVIVAYGSLTRTVSYEEPKTTVTGLVKIGTAITGGAAVQLSGTGGFKRSTTSRSDGSYAFHDVPSGTYTVVASANGARQLTSTVVVP